MWLEGQLYNCDVGFVSSGIGRGGITPAFMWRLNDPRRTSSSVKADVLKYVATYLFVGIIILLMKTRQFVFVRL